MELLVELIKGWKPEAQADFLQGCVTITAFLLALLVVVSAICWGLHLNYKVEAARMDKSKDQE